MNARAGTGLDKLGDESLFVLSKFSVSSNMVILEVVTYPLTIVTYLIQYCILNDSIKETPSQLFSTTTASRKYICTLYDILVSTLHNTLNHLNLDSRVPAHRRRSSGLEGLKSPSFFLTESMASPPVFWNVGYYKFIDTNNHKINPVHRKKFIRNIKKSIYVSIH